MDVSVDFTKHKLLSSTSDHEQRDSTNERIAIVTDNCESAVNCPIDVGIVPISWFLPRYLSISQTHTDVISTRIRTERQCNEAIVIVTDK